LTNTTGIPYMKDECFEWDDVKAAVNWRNYGVSYEMALRLSQAFRSTPEHRLQMQLTYAAELRV